MGIHDLDFCCRPQLVVPNIYSYNGVDVSFSPYDGCSRSAMQGKKRPVYYCLTPSLVLRQSPVNLSQAILSAGLPMVRVDEDVFYELVIEENLLELEER